MNYLVIFKYMIAVQSLVLVSCQSMQFRAPAQYTANKTEADKRVDNGHGAYVSLGQNANFHSEGLITPEFKKKHKIFRIFVEGYNYPYSSANCTGTLISKEGHVLTAAHCINGAIEKTEVKDVGTETDTKEMYKWTVEDLNRYYPNIKSREFRFFNYNRVSKNLAFTSFKDSLLKEKNFAVSIEWPDYSKGLDKYGSHYYLHKAGSDNIRYNSFLNLHGATKKQVSETLNGRLISTHKGYTIPMFPSELDKIGSPTKETDTKLLDALLDSGYGLDNDFAIIQVDQLKGFSCYRFTEDKPQNYDIGILNSYNTHGKNNNIKDYHKGYIYHDNKGPYGNVNNFSLFTSTEPVFGNSGSSLFDKNGYIAGVVYRVSQNPVQGWSDQKSERMKFIRSTNLDINKDIFRTSYVPISRIKKFTKPEVWKSLVELNKQCDVYNDATDSFEPFVKSH